MKRLKIVVVGAKFGEIYLQTMLKRKDLFEVVGILGKGGQHSSECSIKYNIPLYTSANELPPNVDLACVILRAGVMGGEGIQLSKELLQKGIHILHEQPVHYNELSECYAIAKKKKLFMGVSNLYRYIDATQEFIGLVEQIKAEERIEYINVECGHQILYPVLSILFDLTDYIRPFNVEQVITEKGPFDILYCKPVFPTGFYDGVAIIIDTDIVGGYFTSPIDGIEIDFAGLIQKFCSDRCCVVMKTPQELSHIFGELCNPIHKDNLGYLRLKVLEIFLVLSDISAQDDIETSAYFSGDTIKKVKALKAALMEQLDTKISLSELARQYDLSLTMLKDCFKAIYGKPVHAFRREYKMQVATKLLTTTDMSIAELAGKLGYENPNKFSTAFREVIGLSPREYRAKNK